MLVGSHSVDAWLPLLLFLLLLLLQSLSDCDL
jgi:hypothetical protein